MKKILSILLALSLIVTTAGCDEATEEDVDTSKPTEATEPSMPLETEPTNTTILEPNLIGIARPSSGDARQDDWGLKLTARDVSPDGLTIVAEQMDGKPSGELLTGSYYVLENLMDGSWKPVSMLPQEYEIAWTSEAWIIKFDDTTEWPMDWTFLYGSLQVGSYRVGKEVTDFRETGEYDTRMYYADFDIVEQG